MRGLLDHSHHTLSGYHVFKTNHCLDVFYSILFNRCMLPWYRASCLSTSLFRIRFAMRDREPHTWLLMLTQLPWLVQNRATATALNPYHNLVSLLCSPNAAGHVFIRIRNSGPPSGKSRYTRTPFEHKMTLIEQQIDVVSERPPRNMLDHFKHKLRVVNKADYL